MAPAINKEEKKTALAVGAQTYSTSQLCVAVRFLLFSDVTEDDKHTNKRVTLFVVARTLNRDLK